MSFGAMPSFLPLGRLVSLAILNHLHVVGTTPKTDATIVESCFFWLSPFQNCSSFDLCFDLLILSPQQSPSSPPAVDAAGSMRSKPMRWTPTWPRNLRSHNFPSSKLGHNCDPSGGEYHPKTGGKMGYMSRTFHTVKCPSWSLDRIGS